MSTSLPPNYLYVERIPPGALPAPRLGCWCGGRRSNSLLCDGSARCLRRLPLPPTPWGELPRLNYSAYDPGWSAHWRRVLGDASYENRLLKILVRRAASRRPQPFAARCGSCGRPPALEFRKKPSVSPERPRVPAQVRRPRVRHFLRPPWRRYRRQSRAAHAAAAPAARGVPSRRWARSVAALRGLKRPLQFDADWCADLGDHPSAAGPADSAPLHRFSDCSSPRIGADVPNRFLGGRANAFPHAGRARRMFRSTQAYRSCARARPFPAPKYRK